MKTKKNYMNDNFRQQVKEDIQLIQEENQYADPNIKSPDYAFNYWVLSKLYNIDDEYIFNQITDIKDFGVDCYVHYEDTKELFIIQNKYYGEDTALCKKEIGYFLTSPLAKLRSGTYDRNPDLQAIYTGIKDDPEYKVNLHFYLFNDKTNPEFDRLFTDFNLQNKAKEGSLTIQSEIFYYKDILKKYYLEPYDENKYFEYSLKTNNSGMLMQILPADRMYDLPKNMIEAYYIMTPVSGIYKMYEAALNKEYPLFKENIREYLGKSPINEGIKRTLEGEKEERCNFFYYNNGITIICDTAKNQGMIQSKLDLKLTKPQIVNGCQTVNTIYEVVKNYAKRDQALVEKEFGDIWVMTKVLVKKKEKDPDFYFDIVKYTNKQNALSEKAFTSNRKEFSTLQKSLEERGLLITIQGSDKHTFETKYSDKKLLNELLTKANKYADPFGLSLTKLSDVIVPLEKLLQVYLGFMTDGFQAYSKKSKLLKPGNNKEGNIYETYSLKIHENITSDNIIKLWFLFKKAEFDRSKTEKVPIPYYLIGFLGSFLAIKEPANITSFLNAFFNQKKDDLLKQYNFLCDLTGNYKVAFKDNTGIEYNDMIKQKIDDKTLISEMIKLGNSMNYRGVKNQLEGLQHL